MVTQIGGSKIMIPGLRGGGGRSPRPFQVVQEVKDIFIIIPKLSIVFTLLAFALITQKQKLVKLLGL